MLLRSASASTRCARVQHAGGGFTGLFSELTPFTGNILVVLAHCAKRTRNTIMERESHSKAVLYSKGGSHGVCTYGTLCNRNFLSLCWSAGACKLSHRGQERPRGDISYASSGSITLSDGGAR